MSKMHSKPTLLKNDLSQIKSRQNNSESGDHLMLNFNQKLESGKHILYNRLKIINKNINPKLLNESYTSYKVKKKKLFLDLENE